MLLLLTEAITCFVLEFKCSCVAVLEILLPSDSNFAALNLYLWPVHCWKKDWHFQLCWVFPIVTAYCFHRNSSKCFNRMWVKKGVLLTRLFCQVFNDLIDVSSIFPSFEKQKQKCRKRTCCFQHVWHIHQSISRTLKLIFWLLLPTTTSPHHHSVPESPLLHEISTTVVTESP